MKDRLSCYQTYTDATLERQEDIRCLSMRLHRQSPQQLSSCLLIRSLTLHRPNVASPPAMSAFLRLAFQTAQRKETPGDALPLGRWGWLPALPPSSPPFLLPPLPHTWPPPSQMLHQPTSRSATAMALGRTTSDPQPPRLVFLGPRTATLTSSTPDSGTTTLSQTRTSNRYTQRT